MMKLLVATVTAGMLCTASLPAVAQIGHVDPMIGAQQPGLTQVAFRHGPRFRPGWHGGWRGGRGYYGHRGYGYGVGAGIAGLAAGALIGGAIASQAAPAYGAPVYGDPAYGAPAYEAPAYGAPDGDSAVSYCMQRFKSYDPNSGTYLGYDGARHPCP